MVDQREEIERLKAENARLRDKYDSYEQKMDALVWTLTGGLLSKSAFTPNDVLYSTAEESLTDHLKTENAKLQVERDEWHRVAKIKQGIIDHMRDARAENDKLRELVRKWYPHMLKRVGRDALEQWGQMEVVRELGVEAE